MERHYYFKRDLVEEDKTVVTKKDKNVLLPKDEVYTESYIG